MTGDRGKETRDELAAVIKKALEEDTGVDWANEDQSFWDEKNGHLHTGIEGLIDCTVIAEKVIAGCKPRTITTVEELTQLYALDIVLYDDTANGGPLKVYVVPDDGTVCFRNPGEFHFNDFRENYIYAKDMPLPVTVIREAS